MKYLYIFLSSLIVYMTQVSGVVAVKPKINCGALPGCDTEATSTGEAGVYEIIGNLIRLLIEYVAVIAVLAVMIGGIMYLLSGGDEEKTKKAKSVIIWALVGVLVSVFAWSIITVINNFKI